MQPVFDRIPAAALRRLRLRLRTVLCATRSHHQAEQAACVDDVGSDSPVRQEPTAVRDRWFAERVGLGTQLSPEELQHGVNAGIISSTLLIESPQ